MAAIVARVMAIIVMPLVSLLIASFGVIALTALVAAACPLGFVGKRSIGAEHAADEHQQRAFQFESNGDHAVSRVLQLSPQHDGKDIPPSVRHRTYDDQLLARRSPRIAGGRRPNPRSAPPRD